MVLVIIRIMRLLAKSINVLSGISDRLRKFQLFSLPALALPTKTNCWPLAGPIFWSKRPALKQLKKAKGSSFSRCETDHWQIPHHHFLDSTCYSTNWLLNCCLYRHFFSRKTVLHFWISIRFILRSDSKMRAIFLLKTPWRVFYDLHFW